MNKHIKTTDDLLQANLIHPIQTTSTKQVAEQFAIGVTPSVTALINSDDPDDPIAKQFVPSAHELKTYAEELHDPIGDDAHSKVVGIIHRYPDRCLLKVMNVCAVYCRFCFRREKIGPGAKALTPEQLNQAIDYIQQHDEIWEVILTGGDPLIMKPTMLEAILHRLCSIPHVEVIRIHTRIPVVDSARINDQLIRVLENCVKPIYMALHANHPREFTPAALTAINQLVRAGVVMLGQSVLLAGINDDIETLSELMRCFIRARVKPYYLHHADLARGTAHFRTTIRKGQALMKQLRGRFSGLCQPTYVLDIPGGFGKVPLGPNYVNEAGGIEDYKGDVHRY